MEIASAVLGATPETEKLADLDTSACASAFSGVMSASVITLVEEADEVMKDGFVLRRLASVLGAGWSRSRRVAATVAVVVDHLHAFRCYVLSPCTSSLCFAPASSYFMRVVMK